MKPRLPVLVFPPADTPAPRFGFASGPTRIGVWDTAAITGGLAEVLASLNAAQPSFRFYAVLAAPPAGFVARPERLAAWLGQNAAGPLPAGERRLLAPALILNDVVTRADVIRTALGLHALVLLAPCAIAGLDGQHVFWNARRARLGAVAAIALPRAARRPFAAAAAAALLPLVGARHLARFLGVNSKSTEKRK